MAGLATVSAIFYQGMNLNGNQAASGLSQGSGNQVTDTDSVTYVASKSNTTALGADEVACLVYTIAASATQTIDLTALLDLGGQTASLARVKGFRFRLLGTAETSPGGTAGTACSSVKVQPDGTNGFGLNLTGTTPAFTLNNASCLTYTDGSANGLSPVNGTHKIVDIVNNDGVNAAVVVVALVGGTT
jgi:hypothetical protein